MSLDEIAARIEADAADTVTPKMVEDLLNSHARCRAKKAAPDRFAMYRAQLRGAAQIDRKATVRFLRELLEELETV
ncbi:hypothetical protein Salmuc_03810 [Salipiger mucosus DSM 16094]|uniref:Uncharacterized protein n=1 Tax=Salipiger mucosus DSM 16094 TaxID=1123237 RepID=S9QLM2_9RHOB|nr:hypothetical protein Salmuc_03810 [Salipiger mucosus DSM 16094]